MELNILAPIWNEALRIGIDFVQNRDANQGYFASTTLPLLLPSPTHTQASR